MANRGDGFFGLGKVTDDLPDLRIETDIAGIQRRIQFYLSDAVLIGGAI